ncbi:MAG: hypothetical protein P4L36_16915 [Holophaga sp.]|nr:hypothetical protein [Holophaga sp.]
MPLYEPTCEAFLLKYINHIVVVVLLGLLAACGPGPGGPAPGGGTRAYNGAASTGDHLTFTLDPASGVLSYHDLSNGVRSSRVTFTQAVDGSLAFSDPIHNLVALEELPGTALLAVIQKAGARRNAHALVVALPSQTLTPGALAGLSANFMQFRPGRGGIAVGTLKGGFGGSFQSVSFQPYADLLGGGAEPFVQAGITGRAVSQGATGDYLGIARFQEGTAYAFGNPKAWFAVDTPQGSLLTFPKAAGPGFPAAARGVYSALVYEKTGAGMAAPGAPETGSIATGPVTVTIGGALPNSITAVDGDGKVLLNAVPLLPISSFSLTGPGGLGDACNGLFAYEIPATNPASTQWVFVAFPPGGIVFSSFLGHGAAGPGHGAAYDYFYGAGVLQPAP